MKEIEKAIKIANGYKQVKSYQHYVDGFKSFYEEIFKRLPKSKVSLDYGCAYSILSLAMRLRGDEVIAVDMTDKYTNTKMLKDNGIKFVKHNIEKDDLKGKADLIIITEVVEHLNSNPLKSIKRLYNALNDGGSIVCTTAAYEMHGETTSMNNGSKGLWNDLRSWRDIPEYKGKWKDEHTFHYDQFDLIGLFTEAGFKVENIEFISDFSHFLLARK